jgi:hypothetical protein
MYTSTKVEQISAFPPSRQQVCSSTSVILMLKIIWLFRVWQRTQRKNSLMTCSSYHACSRYSWFLILCMSVSMTICHLEHTHLSWKISSQTMGHDNWYHLSIEFRASCFFPNWKSDFWWNLTLRKVHYYFWTTKDTNSSTSKPSWLSFSFSPSKQSQT